MSNPGGPYWQEPSPQYQVDPLTGQPVAYQPPGQQQPPPGGYQGFGMYGPPQPPPRNRTPLIVALVALVVVAIGVTATVLLVNRDDSTPIAGPSSTEEAPTTTTSTRTTARRPTTSSRPPSTSSTPTDVEDITVPPVTAGWQGVLSYKEQVAYDVPKDWEIETPGTIVGFEDNAGKPSAVMHGVTTYKPEACPNSRGSYRGHAGFVTAGGATPEQAAANGVKIFADAAALNKDGSKAPVALSPAAPTKVAGGKLAAVIATATMTVTEPGDCGSPTILFTAVAFKNGSSTALFMMYMDQGVSDALPAEISDKVIASVRPYTG
ncbi:hypothetical protein [Actinokineospora sp. NBRC 105648]|uniref:hypothetical protein n=1 Tax=Actinokineospora sp. NBRC 105648 TaxID=3032206 RepID=UPI0024A22E2D|nr:hypothetical protein [Actinokineospora sp. NBRC 105648]GLZ40066.1 hypothetical protein Acsp05_36900 [Actinokineospora sp. NBRC 105648]